MFDKQPSMEYSSLEITDHQRRLVEVNDSRSRDRKSSVGCVASHLLGFSRLKLVG